MVITMLMMLLIVFLNLAIPICIGVFVYRDAKQRGMEAILWMLVAVLVPGFIGLIIYLIARTKYSGKRCARCGAAVQDDYSVCPHCGASLRGTCSSCGRMVQPDWQVCAHCGSSLAQVQESYIVETPAGGKTLWIALGILAVLFVLILFMMSSQIYFAVPTSLDVVLHSI